jgi:hypothetical protein
LRRQAKVLHFGDELTDFFETATLISPLIPRRSGFGVAHFPAPWQSQFTVLLAYVLDWRWQLTGDNSA